MRCENKALHWSFNDEPNPACWKIIVHAQCVREKADGKKMMWEKEKKKKKKQLEERAEPHLSPSLEGVIDHCIRASSAFVS